VPLVEPKLRIGVLGTVARLGFSFWLLAGYALPGTVWERLSLSNFLSLSQEYVPAVVWHGVVSAFSILLLAYYRYVVAKRVQRVHEMAANRRLGAVFLWWLTAIYVSVYVVAPFIHHEDRSDIDQETKVLLAVAVGLSLGVVCEGAAAVAGVIAMLCSLQAVYALASAISQRGSLLSGTVHRAGGTFGHPAGVYTEMLFALPLAISLALSARNRLLLIIWSTFAVLLIFALLLTWYRAGVLAGSAEVVMLMCWLKKSTRSLLLTVLVCLLAIFVTYGMRMSGVANQTSITGSNSGRMQLWSQGLTQFLMHPLTGVGVTRARYRVMYANAAPSVEYYPEPKSLPIQWLNEMGVGGGLLLIAFVVAVRNTCKASMSAIGAGIGSAWLGLMIAGIFDTPFGTADRVAPTAIAGALIGATMLIGRQAANYERPSLPPCPLPTSNFQPDNGNVGRNA
jgi:O-antigen ligase